MGIRLCKTSDEAPVDYESCKEGWLNNSSSFIEGSIRKYVVLSKNPCAIIGYKSEQKRQQDSICYFCLQDVEFSYKCDSLMLYFKRNRGGKQKWSFFAKDEKELKEWANCIEEIMNKSKASVIKTSWTIGSNESHKLNVMEEGKQNE